MSGHFFLAPDNGVLTLLMDEGEIELMVRVDNSSYFLESVSRTFHGRDIFAPVGAHILTGVDLKELGTPADPKDIVHLDIRRPFVSDKGELVGTVVSIDRFGNLITDIAAARLDTFCEADAEQKLEILIGGNRVNGISGTYAQAGPMSPLAIIGSLGYLEIAVNCGSARDRFMAEKGDAVRVVKT
jgi:S-adenosylmethionine hydrolase